MRMDGAAVLACKTRMYEIAEAGHIPVISAMGNLPVVKDLVVDMGPFWEKMRAIQPYLQPGFQDPGEGSTGSRPQQVEPIHKESLCINCGCCVSECNSMEADPEFLGPAALAKGMRFVGDTRDGRKIERLEPYSDEHGIWDCTRCYFCQQRCPKGVDPRDAIAKLGAEAIKQGIDRDMGAKHAKWFVTSAKTTGWLRETELVPKTQGVSGDQGDPVRDAARSSAARCRRRCRPHVAKDVDQARALYDLVKQQGRDGAAGIVQGEKALERIEFIEEQERREKEAGALEGRVLQGLPRVAVGEGARHLDAGARAEARPRARRARVGHLLRRRRHPRGRARLLPPPERAHPRPRRGDGHGHADDDLQRLHAQPPAGELAAAQRRRLRARVNENLKAVGSPTYYSGGVEVKHLLWLIAEGEGYELLKGVAHKGLKGLKVAPFYGCQILRPSKLLGFEDPDRPSSLERIIEACGGEPIDYPAKIKCCGFPIIQAREDVALGELIQPIEQAIEAGADAMVTPCPLCHLSLDAWQGKLEAATGRSSACRSCTCRS